MLHSWKDTLDYSDNTMELVRGYEKTVNEFFLSVKHFMRTCPGTGVAAFAKWGPEEVALQVSLNQNWLKNYYPSISPMLAQINILNPGSPGEG